MNFLDELSTDHREHLVGIASRVSLNSGEYLVRRGDPGGDLFVVVEGRLAIVDTRTRPTTIIATMESGDVIGEVAFLDRSPRSADVRAEAPAVVLHWRRVDVNELVERIPTLGAAFFEALCRVSVRRLRRLTNHAVATRVATTTGTRRPRAGRATQDAEQLTRSLKTTLRRAELALRADANDAEARQSLTDALDDAQSALHVLGASHVETEAREQLTATLRSELQPWLMRSFLAERSLRRTRGTVGTPETLSHVLVGSASGDGALGEHLDNWLLTRPTMHAIREGKRALATAVLSQAPPHRGRRVLVVNAGTGSVLARLVLGLADQATSITVLDPSRDALGYFDLTDLPAPVSLTAVRHDLAALANGRLAASLPPQDVIVVDDMLCYVPDRLAMTLFRTLQGLLAPGGRIIATGLTPSPDDELMEFLLGWPTIRRTTDATSRLAVAVGLLADTAPVSDLPACVLSAQHVVSIHPTPVTVAPSVPPF